MKERIVTNAWEFATEFPSLKKLNFLPSFFGTSWLFLLLIYQITYTWVLIFDKQNEILQFLINLPKQSYFLWVVLWIVLIFIFFTILNPIARGGIIQMMDTYRKNDGKKFHRSWQWFFDGLSHFLPIFEIQNILAIFSPLTIITFTIFLWRFLDKEFHTAVLIIMWIYFIFALFLNMLFAYAPMFVVFEDKKWTESLSASTSMALQNINITSKLYFTNLILHLRIVIVGWFYLLMPFVISGALAYFTMANVEIFLWIIFIIIAILFFVFIVHLNSVLEIFILWIWYESYKYCKEEQKNFEK